MASLREQLIETTHAFIDSFNEFTAESVVAYRSASCVHRLLPASLAAPPRSNAEYSAFVQALFPVMRGFRLHLVGDPAVDESTRRVVLQLTSSAETAVGPYRNEYVWILTFSANGKEIEEVIEFADSAYTLEALRRLTEAASKR